MRAIITVKIEAESKAELAGTFGGSVKLLREHLDSLHADGTFGPRERVIVRYLVTGGLDEQYAEQEVPLKPKKEPKKPDVK